MSGEPMDLATALAAGREEAVRYPEGPWPAVLAHISDLELGIHELLEGVDGLPLQRLSGAIHQRPAITCPRCGRTSYSPHDVEQGYCGACSRFTAPWRNR